MAFHGCSGLTSIEIPSSVTFIGNEAFSRCTSLASINIPNGVTIIGRNAFSNTGLTSITIPSSVTSINNGTFESCTKLMSIEIPSSVTSIGGYAFNGCTNLATINYLGTQEQWDAITKGSNWNKDCPANMAINVSTIHNIVIEENYFEVFNKPTEALSGSTVTLTGRPWDGFSAYWQVRGNGQTILESHENTISFTMPAYDVYIDAYGRL